jgi:alpha-D-ribose 1-methylphosphonate 5-triphosphate synthase subunit PhnH
VKNKHAFDMVHGAQKVFRILLEALANPGRILSLRPYAAQFTGQGRWLAPAVTLLDKGTGFFWDGDRETGEEIRFLTGAPQVSLEEADFVFLHSGNSGPADQTEAPCAKAARILARVKGGTSLDPHKSALLFIAAGNGEAESSGEASGLKGPGIPPGGRTVRLSPGEAVWRRARDERGFEYPCGVELVFLREDDSILALTRKTVFL